MVVNKRRSGVLMMSSNFDGYISSVEHVYVSTDEKAMLVWGEAFGANDASLLGFTYNYPGTFDDFTETAELQMMQTFAQGNDVPLLWIGKGRFDAGELEVGDVTGQADGELRVNREWLDLDRAASRLQEYFETDYEQMGTSKAKNKQTAGGFHDWSRANLPARFKKQDLDIIVTSDGVTPQYLIELKRSYIDLTKWTPFKADLRNYVLQLKSATGAGSIPLIAYQNKEVINDDSRMTLFQINDIDPDAPGSNWISADRENSITARGLKRRLLEGDLRL